MTELKAEHAEERGQGICRTCLRPIWNEGGTIGHRKVAEGWSDRVEQGGDSVVCFKAADYRHVPLDGREACIYDIAAALGRSITDARVEAAAVAIAKAQDADYWTDEIADWEGAEEWEREAHPDNYPHSAFEDRDHYRKSARGALEAAAGVR